MGVVFREANRDEVPEIVALLRDDVLGQGREAATLDPYFAAFDQMQTEGGNLLFVGIDDNRAEGARVVATYQLTFISGLSLKAARRAQIESVRVHSDLRGQGLGEAMFVDAENRARAAGCGLLQLTTNKARNDAQRFYDRLGYVDSHVGYKKTLD
jgi:GNAT superfamily N-acetyltransferase